MYDPLHVYSFDIETDNSAGKGLDPRAARITEISIATAAGPIIFNDASERDLLEAFGRALRDLPAGLVSGWNSAFFDWAFIATRRDIVREQVGPTILDEILTLLPQPGLKPKYDFTPGHTCGYTALVAADGGVHAHLDISLAWKPFAESFGTKVNDAGKTVPVVPWSLKPVAQAAGIEMFVIDRERLHEYSQAERDRYVASDTIGTRELTLRTLGLSD